MARSRDYLNNGGYENVDTSTSNNSAYSTQQTTHQMSSTPAVRTQNTAQTSASKPGKYSFNGNVYSSYEAAQQAQKAHQQKVQATQAMNEADLASVNYDFNKYNTLKNSGQLLSQISNDEWKYISKLQKTDTSPTAYTKSVRDQYLYSLGLPSSKDLNKYRKKYNEYASTGGILDVYKDLSDDELSFIRQKFGEDFHTGLGGGIVDSKGNPLKYSDTLLDTQLQANGLPSASKMEEYHTAYLADRKEKQDFANKKQGFYDMVMRLEKDGMDAQSAWYRALSEPEYASLSDRVMEPALDPDINDSDYDSKMMKAVEQNNKFKAAEDTRISRIDYSRYAIKKEREQNEERRAAEKQEKLIAAQTAMSTPAYTREEKEAQTQAISDYISAYDLKNEDGSPVTASDFSGYLSLINLGVPANVIEESYTSGLPALIKWNDEQNKGDFRKWSEIRMALDGISQQNGDYNAIRDLMTRTHVATMSSDYGTASQYDPLLFAKEQDMSRSTSRSNAVSVNGALYAMVNGQEFGNIVDATPAQREMVRDLTEKDSYTGKSLLDYLSEDERGAFNTMFRESPSQAYRYLDDLQTVLERRAENEMLNRYLFANSKQDSEDTAYELNMRSLDAEMSSRKPGQTNYWEAEAWEKYRDYSDEALQRLTDENIAVISDPTAGTSTEEKMDAQLNLQDIQFVLDQREKARDSASLSSALYGYTDKDGQNATETVKQNIGQYEDSRYARLVNGLVKENELEGGDYTNVGSGTMTIDLGGLKSYETDELAPVIAEMTDEQRNQFNYILVNEGAEAADAYIEQIWRGIDTAAKNKVRAEQAGMVEDSLGGGLAASVEKVFWLPYSGLMSATGTALNKALDLDVSQTQAAKWDLGGGVQSAVSQNISDSIEDDTLASVANFFYNVGMSSAESSLGGLLSRGMPFVGEFALAGSAYTSTLASSLEKGLSQDKAVQTATTAAIVEWITEHMGIGGVTKGLEKAAERGAVNGWKWWQSALAQAGIQFLPEALEEGAGNVMNTAFDLIINGDKAELVQTYNDAIARGYTPEEATKLAAVEFAKDTGLEMLAGGLAGSGTVVSGAVTQLAQAAPQVGMKVALDTLGRYAYGDQARASRGHSNVFSEGRGIIDSMYGAEHGDLIQTYLDQRETVGDKKGIDSVGETLKSIGKESELYDVLYDSNGNSKLSDAERTALASMLYLDGAEVDLDSIEATYIAEQAGKQTARERSANTNNDAIKSAVEIRNVKIQMEATKTAMENATADFEAKYQTDLDSANAKLADAKSRQAGLLSKLRAAQGDSKAQTKLFDSLSAVNTEITNLQASVDSANEKMESARRNLEAANTGRQHEIDRMQHILDAHYASADNLIKTATGNKRTLEMRAAAARRRVKELGAVLDQLLEGEFADASDSAWVESVQEDLTQARDELERIERFANRNTFATVSEALNAIKSGNSKRIVDRINSASANSQNAVSASVDADSSAPAEGNATETGNVSSSEETSENERVEAPVEAIEKKTFNISKATQERFSRIAKRFGCDIVWQTSAEIGGNGKYDPQNPNTVYLATDMLADRNLPTDMVVARQFFTHEIVHYVANTRTYQSLSVLAERYYTENGFDYEQLIQNRIAEEKEQYGRDISRETAREELTAVFAQDVLFAEEDGASLNWVAKADGTVVRNFLTTVEYLIKRGNVRRMKDGSAVKTLLLDSEYALAKAIGERKALDNAGISSAFAVPTAAQAEPAPEQETETPKESIKDVRTEMTETSDGEVRYSRGDSIADMRQAYGIKKQNEYGRSNNIVTPARTRADNRVSDVAQTLKEIPGISQEARDSIDDILAEAKTELEHGGLVYKPVTMEEMRQQGHDYITKAGSLYQAMHDLAKDIENAQLKDLQKLEAAAAIVFEEITHTDDSAVFASPEYADFVSAIGMMNSQWGRMGKAMQLMKDSPLGRRKYMEKVVEHINAENEQVMSKFLNRTLNRKNVGKTIDISESLYRDLEAARTPAEIRAAEYRISEEIGRQSPLTIEDAVRNWRYFSMLGNFVTHERNMLGNLSMLGMRTAKDAVASGLEALATKAGIMNQNERTHSLKSTKEITDYAKQLFAENAETVQGTSKYDVRSKMKDAVKKSPFKAIDSLIRFNSNALEMEDKLFLYATYVAAAKSYMSAQGIDPSNITAEQKANINAYATQQAQEATYRDASKIADMLNNLSKTPYVGTLMEAIMPFKKTPVNIARRGLEYSPASLVKGLWDIAQYARKNGNKVPASKICDELGKGIVGSALTLIGAWLAKSGILKLKAGDDDRSEALGKDFGHQDYSLEIGDYSIKIESIAPMTFPLFAGAAYYDARKNREDADGEMNWNNVLTSLFEAVSTISDPLMDMSFMSSLNSALSSYSDNTIGGILTNALTSYVGQFAPTLLGKVNQTLTPTRRTTKSAASAKDVIPGGGTVDYALRSIASKIPGGTALLEPYVKLTGEYDTKDSAEEYALAVMNNFLSPVNVQRIDTTPVAEEMSRVIAATGNTEFVPRNPQKYFRANKETYNLTAKEYTEYSKDHNETVYAMLSDVINSRDYQRADDDEKVDMLKKAYTTAHNTIMKKWKAIILEKRGAGKNGTNDEVTE